MARTELQSTTILMSRSSISIASATDNEIIPTPGVGRQLVIVQLILHNNGAGVQTTILKEGTTVINGAGIAVASNTNIIGANILDLPLRLADNKSFVINLSAATNVSGWVQY